MFVNLLLEKCESLKNKASQQHSRLRLVDARKGINKIPFVVIQADLDDLVSQVGRVGVHEIQFLRR